MSAEEFAELQSLRQRRTTALRHHHKTKMDRYLSKHAVCAGALTFMLSGFVKQGMTSLMDALFFPLEHVDANFDGVSDVKQLTGWEVSVGPGFEPIPCGKILVQLLKSLVGASVTIVVVYALLERTHLLDDDLDD